MGALPSAVLLNRFNILRRSVPWAWPAARARDGYQSAPAAHSGGVLTCRSMGNSPSATSAYVPRRSITDAVSATLAWSRCQVYGPFIESVRRNDGVLGWQSPSRMLP